MSDIQLKGTMTLATVDVSAYVSSAVISRTRQSITRPATFGNIRQTQAAGALVETLTLNFFSSTAAASMWADLYDAIDTDTAELAFECTLNEGAAGPDNPEFSGTIVVLGVDTGAAVGTLREQSQTYPITAAGITKDIGA
jgi:hypothetical protein